MRLKSLAAVALLSCASLAQAGPFSLIANGGFETGDLTGWTVSGSGSPGATCSTDGRNWNVSTSGAATGCDPVASPFAGTYAAYVMNDGFAGYTYTLSQDFIVPGSVLAAMIGWHVSATSLYEEGALRKLNVDILSGTTVLSTIHSMDMAYNDEDASWESFSFDITSLLAAHAGETLTLRFQNLIPESWTFPGGLGLDEVLINGRAADPSEVPEPAGVMLVGLGLLAGGLARRRK